jgi:hypothetical protein
MGGIVLPLYTNKENPYGYFFKKCYRVEKKFSQRVSEFQIWPLPYFLIRKGEPAPCRPHPDPTYTDRDFSVGILCGSPKFFYPYGTGSRLYPPISGVISPNILTAPSDLQHTPRYRAPYIDLRVPVGDTGLPFGAPPYLPKGVAHRKWRRWQTTF